MNSKAEALGASGKGSNLDTVKWVAVAVLVAGAIFGYHHFEQYPAVFRALALIPVAAICVFIALQTERGAALWGLMREATVEIRRVVWPTRPEAVQTTLVVLAAVVVMALILWGLDALFGKLISLFVG